MNKTRIFIFTASIQHSIKSSSQSNCLTRQEKKKTKLKGITDNIWSKFISVYRGQEEVKLSLFTEDRILYIENTKDYIYTNTFTQTLWEQMDWEKAAVYKIIIQKSVVFLFLIINNPKKKLKKIWFTITSKSQVLRNKVNKR